MVTLAGTENGAGRVEGRDSGFEAGKQRIAGGAIAAGVAPYEAGVPGALGKQRRVAGLGWRVWFAFVLICLAGTLAVADFARQKPRAVTASTAITDTSLTDTARERPHD